MDLHTSCTICDNQYDEKKRRPLVLPCSHSFCQDCLQQVQAAGEKLCPVCRKTWNNVLLSDLLSCYQLIPVDKPDISLLKAMRKRKWQDSADPDMDFDVCKEHKSDLSLFCESCELPVCRKCLLLKHKGCEMVLMEEKCDAHQEKFKEKISEFESKFSKTTSSLLENVKNMAVVRPFIVKLLSYEKEMQDYQKDLKDWQMEADKVLAVTDDGSAAPLLCNIQNSQHNEAVVEKLALQMPNSPASPLLLAIASAYQEALDNSDSLLTTFIEGMKKFNEGASTSWQSVDEVEPKRAARIAALYLKEREEWNILDDIVADAAMSVLQTTSLRPSSIKISCSGVTDEKMTALAPVVTGNKQYQVTLIEKLNNFVSIDTPSHESLAATTLRLDALVKHSPWASLTHFWGHLDVKAVNTLPKTIQSLGLALRDETDMASVNELCGLAFDGPSRREVSNHMHWPQFKHLDLSISKTFKPAFWLLSWRKSPKKPNIEGTPITLNAVAALTVTLHLLELLPEDLIWMAALLKEMRLEENIKWYKNPLYLPGARVDPDPLLGVLRDNGQRWDVHLPVCLPQLVPTEEMTERYRKYNHTITFDL